MTIGEQIFFDRIVHGLRSIGWSRIDAESEALDRIEKLRAAKSEHQSLPLRGEP